MSETNSDNILVRLEQVISERRQSPSTQSYTSQLLTGGLDAIAQKIMEEARELIEAAKEGASETEPQKARDHVVYEAADLLFHTWVLLGHSGVTTADVFSELGRRFGTSGLTEKASRNANVNAKSKPDGSGA